MDSKKYTEFGEELKETISNAIGSKNFNKLSKNVSDILNGALDLGTAGISKAKDSINKSGIFGKNVTKEDYPINKKALPKGYGVVPFVCGIAGLTVSLLLFSAISIIVYVFTEDFPIIPIALMFFGIGGFCVMISSGRRAMKLKKTFTDYCKVMQGSSYFLIDDIAKKLCVSHKQAVKDIDRLIWVNAFPQGHIDPNEKYFIGTDETYQNYLSSLELMQKKQEAIENNPQYEEIRDTISKGREYIKKIRAANEAIEDEPMSKKLDDTEMILMRIFDRIEDKPELLPEVRKLLEYYLPITQKLLDAYIDFDAQELEAENILNAKNEIEKSLDSINTAFLNLYNRMFHDEKTDIISDIDVLRSMFAQEGLNNSDFNKKG